MKLYYIRCVNTGKYLHLYKNGEGKIMGVLRVDDKDFATKFTEESEAMSNLYELSGMVRCIVTWEDE